MKIQNRALAGVELGLRFSPGQTATGDAHGVFDLPPDDALFLLSTSGWERTTGETPEGDDLIAQRTADAAQASLVRDQELAAEAAKAAEAAALAASPPIVASADEAAEKAAEADAANVTAGVSVLEEPISGAGPDLTKLDREGLIKVAAEYGVAIDKRWGDERLRATLEVALYGDDEKE